MASWHVDEAAEESIPVRPLRCLQDGPDCEGKVEYHLNPDREDFKAFPRCEHHQRIRLAEAKRTLELRSDAPPSWFDPSYAGERWDEDD